MPRQEMRQDSDKNYQHAEGLPDLTSPRAPEIAVTLLTGGGDRPYAFGLGTELLAQGAAMDFIGSDDLDCSEFHSKPGVNFLNLRGDQRPEASFARKVYRLALYYARLLRYAS